MVKVEVEVLVEKEEVDVPAKRFGTKLTIIFALGLTERDATLKTKKK